MKNFLPSVGLISFLIFTISQSIQAQDAPVTMIGYMVSCPSEQALVPVTVINCPAITSFSLHMEYDPRVMVFIDAVNINGSLAGMEFHDNHVSESVHKIMFTWVNFIPQYFYPENKLFDLHFTCLSGTSSILFNNTVNNGIECEYTDAAGNPLNDVPTASFYIDGQVSSYLVGPAGEITGKDSVCPGETGIGYTVTPVSFASGYVWTLPPGATITAGNNTNSVLVDFSTAASSGAMRVYGTSECGSGTYSPDFLITVNPLPTPTISADPPIPNEGTQVGQITEFSTEADMFEYEWTIDPGLAMVLSGDNTNILTVQWIAPGTCPVTVNYTNEQDCRPVSPVTTEVFIRLLKYVISGNVNYNNSILTPVDSVKLYLSRNAAIVDSTTTDDAGHYEFLPQSDGDYNVNGVSLKPWAGVNGTDVCQLRRYIAWLQPNSLNEPIRILAGDVNNDGWINGSDVIGLTRKIIGLSSSLSRLWIFSKPTIGGNTITVNGSNLNQNLFGLCTGDVNGSLGANISPTSDAPVVKIGSYCSS
ncbi:MAG: dockerin type I domain-containing protein, partial [Bacteroidota bacterium]